MLTGALGDCHLPKGRARAPDDRERATPPSTQLHREAHSHTTVAHPITPAYAQSGGFWEQARSVPVERDISTRWEVDGTGRPGRPAPRGLRRTCRSRRRRGSPRQPSPPECSPAA
ncbi:hypothetical protein FAIPA1_40173 [Frankia sp. AiPs1]